MKIFYKKFWDSTINPTVSFGLSFAIPADESGCLGENVWRENRMSLTLQIFLKNNASEVNQFLLIYLANKFLEQYICEQLMKNKLISSNVNFLYILD